MRKNRLHNEGEPEERQSVLLILNRPKIVQLYYLRARTGSSRRRNSGVCSNSAFKSHPGT
jgi:hypothetical protein